jgi:hypothetical protein
MKLAAWSSRLQRLPPGDKLRSGLEKLPASCVGERFISWLPKDLIHRSWGAFHEGLASAAKLKGR